MQLVELVISAAVLSLALAVTMPPLRSWGARVRVEVLARRLAATLLQARSLATRHSVNVGVKFRTLPDGRIEWATYRDGDGDGVMNTDIESGVDPRVVPIQSLPHIAGRIGFGFPPGPPPRDPGSPHRRLSRLHDPIRFNRSDLATFGPLGGSTPGSIYVSDGRWNLAVVRVFGRTGKVRVLSYDVKREAWN